jgi:hypothetical protein
MHLAFRMGMAYNRLDLVSKDKWVTTTQPIHVFDFNHAKFIFSSTKIGIKPISIEEHCFKILIPGKVIYLIMFLMIL